MTQDTSSAEYLQLYHYSDAALQFDNNVVGEANRLLGALLHFEATCREPGYRLPVAHVADGMVMYGGRAAVVDTWVRVVGLGFQAADGGGLAALLPGWLPPWLVWPWPIRWPVDPGFIIGPRPQPRPPMFVWPPYRWGLPPWIGRLPWLPPDQRRIEIPKQPVPPVIQLPQEPKIIIDDPRQKMPKIIPEPATGSGGNAGETELGKILRPPVKEALRQDQVKDNDPLLDATRYERDGNGNLIKEGAWFGAINTVRDHIKAYGCLMTSFTMLLRDQGQNVTVTDLYRANYNAKDDKHSIDEDLARNDDQDAEGKQDVVLQNLNLTSSAVKDVAKDKYQAADGESLQGNDSTAGICRNLAAHGSVIIQVKTTSADGHWVVVDSYDAVTGTFTLRDPMKGLVTGVKIPSDAYKPKGPVKYLQPL